MSKKKVTRLQKSTEVQNESKHMQWCYVNVDNEFLFMGRKYVISEQLEEYKVFNKAGAIYDYTNEAYMEEILATINHNNNLIFYNQNYDLIDDKYIKYIG